MNVTSHGAPNLHFLMKEDSNCWEWVGNKDSSGYGRFRRNNREVKVHREMYERTIGKIPPGLVVMHSCDNPACSNPLHLSIGTNGDNQKDKFMKGRQAKGENVGGSRLTEDDVLYMRRLHFIYGLSRKVIAEAFSIHLDTAQKAIRGINWKYVKGETL